MTVEPCRVEAERLSRLIMEDSQGDSKPSASPQRQASDPPEPEFKGLEHFDKEQYKEELESVTAFRCPPKNKPGKVIALINNAMF